MRWLKLGAIIALYVAGVSFCFDWRPWEPLVVFFPRPILLFVCLFAVYSLFQPKLWATIQRLFDAPAWLWVLACGGFTTFVASFLTYSSLEAVPHVPDDICYYWQARIFALGRIYAESHDLPEFFNLLFMINDGKWYSLFQPGWPALLSLGVLSGTAYQFNPFLAGLATALVYPIGRRVFNARTAKLGMMILAFSPMHQAIGATLLAHTFSCVLTELAVLAVLRLGEKNQVRDALLLGLALGWLFTTRAMNATVLVAACAFPLGYYLLTRRVGWLTLLAGVPVSALFFGLQMGYNATLTGEPLRWPQDRYFDMTEPKPGCHHPGFGTNVGCPNVHPEQSFPDGYTVWDAFQVTHLRLGTFLLTLFGLNMLFLFIGGSFLNPAFGARKYFLLAVFLSLLAGYFAFYFHGFWGRYYYESCFAIFLLVAGGLVSAQRGLAYLVRERHALVKRLGLSLIPGVALTYFFFNTFFFIPSVFAYMSQFFFGVDRRMEQMTQGFPEHSIIFMEDWYQTGFIYIKPDLSNTRLFVRDMGKHNRLLMQYYPDWHFYRYSPKTERITSIKVNSEPSPVFLEAEGKLPIGDSSGEYAFTDYFASAKNELPSGREVMTFEAKGPGSYVAFRQFLFVDGDYLFQLRFATGPDRGKVKLSIDGWNCPEEADLYSAERDFMIWSPPSCQPIKLLRGQHRIRLEVSGKNETSEGHRVSLDWMLFEKVGAKAAAQDPEPTPEP